MINLPDTIFDNSSSGGVWRQLSLASIIFAGRAFRLATRVAALPCNQWQLSCGMGVGGRLPVESVTDLEWNIQLTSYG